MSDAPVPEVSDDSVSTPVSPRPKARRKLYSVLAVFTLLRFGLTAVLALLLMLVVPFLFAMAVALILQLPIAMVLFARQRAAVSAALAEANASRRAERNDLRSALRGEG